MQQIPGYPDYACDEQGNVYSLKFNKIRKMKASDNGNGYLKVVLSVNNRAKTFNVHRLIAKTFLKDYNEDLEVDHIDRCKSNNSLDNLRMVNHSENMQNTTCKGYSWDKQKNKWKARIGANGKFIHIGHYDTEEEAGEAYLKGKQKYHVY